MSVSDAMTPVTGSNLTESNPCSTCYYSWLTAFGPKVDPVWACDYILKEQRRRPCKYGPGCTVYKPKEPDRVGWDRLEYGGR